MPASQESDPIDRRRFLGILGAAGLGGAALSACAAAGAAPGRRLERIGVQLYTVRDRMRADVAGTLRAVAALGYAEVETAGLFDLAPERFREALDAAGLVSPAGHYSIDDLRREPEPVLATARTLGQQWAVVPWLAEGERNAEGYRRVAADLNRFGAAGRHHGVRIAWHNHDFEFAPLPGGGTGFDILVAETDPALVDLELDVYWAVQGRQDPAALVARHPGRTRLCHVKDMAGVGGARTMVDVGQGAIDFASILTAGREAGLAHFFVEHDTPADSLASIRNSIQHLRRLTF
ncbi:MAG TPA: sugar phosphate isomerase/epimerase [Longimicrobium sp.]